MILCVVCVSCDIDVGLILISWCDERIMMELIQSLTTDMSPPTSVFINNINTLCFSFIEILE